jgi:lysophospholipase L1-like esterase
MKLTLITLLVNFLLMANIQYTEAQSMPNQDWPNLGRYRDSNRVLKSMPVPKNRVVFMGNSITDNWIHLSPEFFYNNNYVGRGIGGQTSPQMLVRFRADVIELQPKVVVIECGTNDIAGNTGFSTLEMIENNISSMTELATANKIKVIIGSVPPASAFGWRPDVHPADSIIELNAWIKVYAAKQHFIYLDYYTDLVNDEKGMKKEYSEDGVHPNRAGYTVMEVLAKAAITKSLGK